MKNTLLILVLLALFGCTSSKAVLPTTEGKPRISINKPAPATRNNPTE